jgi:uncharacterized protein (TIGR00369 family)
MQALNPDFCRELMEQVNRSPYYAHASMEVTSVEEGGCRVELEVGEKHMQPYGMVHGGVYAALVDAAAYWAVYTRIDDAARMLTIDLKLNYLGAVSSGRLIAHGRCIKAGRTIALGEATVVNEGGRLQTHGLATFMIRTDLRMNADLHLPPRHLK